MKPDRLDPEPETETETETFISPRSCAFPLDGSGLARPQFPFCLAEASDDFRSTTDARLVDRIGREVPQGLMWPLAIVEGERLSQSQEQLGQAGVALEIDVLVLDAASQALDEQVVRCPPAFTHADGDPFTLEDAGEDHAGERCPLVGLEDLRPALWPDGTGVAPVGLLLGQGDEVVQALDGLGEALERGGDDLALVQEA